MGSLSKPAIEVIELEKSYGTTQAVDGVSFRVEQGEVFALLGPNGAGKTTMIEILEGHRRRDGGQVRVLEFDPETGGSAFRERIGIMLQEGALEPQLKVRELLEMHVEFYPRPRPVQDIIDLVGIAEKSNARIKTLSSGLRRRLEFALALVGDPDLVFLDEPTTGFDPESRRWAWDLVKRFRGLGKSVLLTTHYMDEAQYLADRLAVAVKGKIVAVGSLDGICGSSDRASLISFRLPGDATVQDLPPTISQKAKVTNGQVQILDAAPTGLLRELTGWALGKGHELSDLQVKRPTLEERYLELIRDDRKKP